MDGIWDYTVETWSEEQAVLYYRQIYTTIQGLSSLPVFLEKEYDVIMPGLFGFKIGAPRWFLLGRSHPSRKDGLSKTPLRCRHLLNVNSTDQINIKVSLY